MSEATAVCTVPVVVPLPIVELVVLDATAADLRRQVLDLTPAADQLVYSGQASDTLPETEADPFRVPFAVVHRGEAVGYGTLGRTPMMLALLPVDPARTAILRAFYIDVDSQGRGLGRAAISAVPALVRTLWPDVDHLALTVNVTNVRAREAYLATGFYDAGERYTGGPAGTQHVLHRRVPS